VAWSASKIFMAFLEDALENVDAKNLSSDSFKAALYDNDITPDQTVATASTVYNAGVWAIAGNEVSDGAEWPATGEVLDSPTSTRASNVYTFDADNTVSTGTSATLANVYGCLVYDDTVADRGLCYNYFGGVNSVTDGTFTIVWNASGIFTITA
jgi:hypothetical protein